MKPNPSLPRILFLGVIAIGLAAGCSSNSSSSSSPTNPTPTPAADVTIVIQGNRGNQSFSPEPAMMRVGQSVAWRNADSITHNATQDASRFATPNLGAGTTSAPIAMNTAGTFTYHCTIHPGMIGTLVVQ
jgi:plastocyanin